jgi:hypothetical protein
MAKKKGAKKGPTKMKQPSGKAAGGPVSSPRARGRRPGGFCCGCGFELLPEGTCPNTNPPCDFGGDIPNCD